MAGIVVLDEITAGQIAAGEVVERPVSAVKELVENALDAGATRITVDLTDGGLSKIVVTDNGCGISPEDAGTAFLRHATSKIKSAADLRRVHTLGFRGEALPSIAAVAKVEMTTRTHDAMTGACARVQGGASAVVSAAGCSAGTRVEVRDIFYNTPVRRKSMKSPSVEGGLCGELLSKIALSRPDVRFDFSTAGRRVFYTPGAGKLAEVMAAIYGAGQTKEMLLVNGLDGDLALTGYVGKPSLSRSTRSHQTIIINGRYVRCPLVVATAEREYHGLLPAGRKPVLILSLTVATDKLDVNVHPAKQEVRLLEERRVAALVAGALRRVLRGDAVIPSALKPENEGRRSWIVTDKPERVQMRLDLQEDEPVSEQIRSAAGLADSAPRGDEFAPDRSRQSVLREDRQVPAGSGSAFVKAGIAAEDAGGLFGKAGSATLGTYTASEDAGAAPDVKQTPRDAGTMPADKQQTLEDAGTAAQNTGFAERSGRMLPKLYPLSHLLPVYILAEGEDGLYIIDQHAAHERVLYEECLAGQGDYPSQYLLVPETLELEHSEMPVAVELLPVFNKAGFVIEHFGGNTFLLRGAPSYLPVGREKELFRDMLDYYKDKGAAPDPADFFKRLAASIACKGAIKAGEKMPYKTMEALLDRLSRTENPFTCPHGRPTVIHISHRDLRARFLR